MHGLRRFFRPVLVGSASSKGLRQGLSRHVQQASAVEVKDDADLARMPMNGQLIVYVDDGSSQSASSDESLRVLISSRAHMRIRVPSELSKETAADADSEPVTATAKYINERLNNARGFVSTRGDGYSDEESGYGLGYVLRKGLARDGGLFLPWSLTKVPKPVVSALDRYAAGDNACYAAYASAVLETLVDAEPAGACLTLPALQKAVKDAYDSPHWRSRPDNAPLVEVALPDSPPVHLLELYHGPTCAFKDFALQLFPHLFVAATADDARRYVIATATSGDTGVACMHGFQARGVPTTIFYPTSGVSPVQRDQMLAIADGSLKAATAAVAARKAVASGGAGGADADAAASGMSATASAVGGAAPPVASAVAVDSDFDLCQSSLKQLFNDSDYVAKLRESGVEISSANSINWGRLLPQVVYYAWAAARLRAKGVCDINGVDYCVPTGNFGNILAAYIAMRVGLLNVRRFVLASNENDVLCEFIQTGVYDTSARALRVTTSPSIDILRSSNVERFVSLLVAEVRGAPQPDVVAGLMRDFDKTKKFVLPADVRERMQSIFWAGKATEREAHETLQRVHKESGVLLDTHTAVGATVMAQWQATAPSPRPCVLVGTAHWAKFPAAVLSALKGVHDETTLNTPPKDAFEQIYKLTSLRPPEPLREAVHSATTPPTAVAGTVEGVQGALTKSIFDVPQ